MTLLINFRHLVYGLSMLEKFRGMGPRKFYDLLLTDDGPTPCSASVQVPAGVVPAASTSPSQVLFGFYRFY
ncbi:MAG: AzlC family ABC transporter permease [Oscillospiraceae bacterium]